MKIGDIVFPKTVIMKREIEGYGPGETSIGDKFRILELPLFTYKLD